MTFHLYKPNKNLIFAFLSAIAALMLLTAVPAQSQTPDETTPAEEAVCDVLQRDSTTKGLYGLCVAFCEAQDFTELSDPITVEELQALEASAPSGKILENYNKRKQDSDPAMPCILELAPGDCPCFSDAELSYIDGINPDGTQAESFTCRVDFLFNPNTSHVLSSSIWERDILGGFAFGAQVSRNGEGRVFCDYRIIETTSFRTLSSEQGTLTSEQHEICRVKLNEYIPTTACTTF